MKSLCAVSILVLLGGCTTAPMAAAPPPPPPPSSIESSTLVGKATRPGWCNYKDATGRIVEAKCKAS